MRFSSCSMNRRRRSGRQRVAQLSEDCILLSSDSESEQPNRTLDLTDESDEVVDLTAISDLSVIVIDSPSTSERSQRYDRRRRRTRSTSNSRLRPTRTSRSRSENATIPVSDYFGILSERSANSEHLSNGQNSQLPSPEQSVSTLNHRDGSSIDNQVCPLCLDTYKEIKTKGRTLVSTTCGHVFCKACALQCVNSNCPTCRKRLNAKSIHPLYL